VSTNVSDELFNRVCHESALTERFLVRLGIAGAAISFVGGVFVGWFVISPLF